MSARPENDAARQPELGAPRGRDEGHARSSKPASVTGTRAIAELGSAQLDGAKYCVPNNVADRVRPPRTPEHARHCSPFISFISLASEGFGAGDSEELERRELDEAIAAGGGALGADEWLPVRTDARALGGFGRPTQPR
jgi:hypothetical protein